MAPRIVSFSFVPARSRDWNVNNWTSVDSPKTCSCTSSTWATYVIQLERVFKWSEDATELENHRLHWMCTSTTLRRTEQRSQRTCIIGCAIIADPFGFRRVRIIITPRFDLHLRSNNIFTTQIRPREQQRKSMFREMNCRPSAACAKVLGFSFKSSVSAPVPYQLIVAVPLLPLAWSDICSEGFADW